MGDEAFLEVARAWTWAGCMREQFGIALKSFEGQDPVEFYRTPEAGYMFVWYGLLFAVCQRLRGERVKVPGVQSEIDEMYDPLRLCRNATFHLQGEYWSRKLLDFVTREDTAEKIHRIHDGVGRWIQSEMLNRGLASPPDFS